ncbi:MAG: beta-N-acetylhexosaminidase [Bacillota bacterium]
MLQLIPKPSKYIEGYGDFIISDRTQIYADEELMHCKQMLVNIVEDICKYTLQDVVKSKADISFLFDAHLSMEGYRIKASEEGLRIYASTYNGGLYAVQTLKQLCNLAVINEAEQLALHYVEIEDAPRYKWRGLMLDEARWFFGADAVKRLLTTMSEYKLNVLHWHLTDNEGWRIAINKYPKLTETGSHRRGTQNVSWLKGKDIDWTAHDGFYTQDEIKDIVAFASELGIMIVPEIDMPAHFGSAIAAYPELSCSGKLIETPISHMAKDEHSHFDLIACVGKESTYTMIYDIIDELCELFPAPYFHIGGDEAPKKEWKACPLCQKVMENYNLKNEEELQGFFNNKIALHLNTKGRELIGWNEILKAESLDNSVVAQYWVLKEDKNVTKFISKGGKVIMSKHQSFYFDMPYAMHGLKKTYDFDAGDYGVSDSSMLGVEGAIWSEWIYSQDRLDYQLYPRMQALAEVAWSVNGDKSYREFTKRLKKHLPTLKAKGIKYCKESMWNANKIKSLHTMRQFHTTDAHIEYKKALSKRKPDTKG